MLLLLGGKVYFVLCSFASCPLLIWWMFTRILFCFIFSLNLNLFAWSAGGCYWYWATLYWFKLWYCWVSLKRNWFWKVGGCGGRGLVGASKVPIGLAFWRSASRCKRSPLRLCALVDPIVFGRCYSQSNFIFLKI